MTKQTFEILGKLDPALSPNARCHFMTKHRATQELKTTTWGAIKASGIKPVKGRVYIQYTVVVPDGRQRDQDNFQSMCIPIANVLKNTGIIQDDDSEHVIYLPLLFKVTRREPQRVIVEMKSRG